MLLELKNSRMQGLAGRRVFLVGGEPIPNGRWDPSFADGKSGGLVPGAGWGLLGASFSQLNREDRKLECNSPGRGGG